MLPTSFREVWAVDFEFYQPSGERPTPLCVVAREMRTGRLLRLWLLGEKNIPCPYPLSSDSLFVAYYASAELGCHLALDWPFPARILDLCAEFRCLTSGLKIYKGHGLLSCLNHFGLYGIRAAEKSSMQALAMRGPPYSPQEQSALLDYCQTDVDALRDLLPRMLPQIDLPRALLRGRYMGAVARMEGAGTPLDMATLERLRAKWAGIQTTLIARVDKDFGVYDGRTFKSDRFAQYLENRGIAWPCLSSGKLCLDDKTFKDMCKLYPELNSLRELRNSLSRLRLSELAVGSDGRNRCLLSAFASQTGRNQPSNSKFIFGPDTWVRGLIKPPAGHAVAYLDYEQQEFGIAAALSQDPAMMDAYRSGDPYLTFAKQAGAVPGDATKQSHRAERERFKQCALAVQYGMGAESLAVRIADSPAVARELLRLHHSTYAAYWKWSDAVQDTAMLNGELRTVFGWTVHAGFSPNPRSLRNFPVQGNGAEMLRLACCLLTESGHKVCCPIHDAVLIESPIGQIERAVEGCQAVMRQAGEIVLDGVLTIRTEAKIVQYPDRYMDDRGREFWDLILDILDKGE